MTESDTRYSCSLSQRFAEPVAAAAPSDEYAYLFAIRSSLEDMVGGCRVCRFSTKENAWEGLFCTVHHLPVLPDQDRCEEFERRGSPVTAEENREQVRRYVNSTLGIKGPLLKRLVKPE
jgi:hypothetical protein